MSKTPKRVVKARPAAKATGVGISNRESPVEEERERRVFSPVDAGSPPPEDAGGDSGERGMAPSPDRQTSHKAGSRSIAQKESGSKYADRSAPSTRKVAGAFGREELGRLSGMSGDPHTRRLPGHRLDAPQGRCRGRKHDEPIPRFQH